MGLYLASVKAGSGVIKSLAAQLGASQSFSDGPDCPGSGKGGFYLSYRVNDDESVVTSIGVPR
jgi:hypothetical protein